MPEQTIKHPYLDFVMRGEEEIALLTVMKKETEVVAEKGGIVREIKAKPEEIVDAGALLLTIESDSA